MFSRLRPVELGGSVWITNKSVLKQEFQLNIHYMTILEGILSPKVTLVQEQVSCHGLASDKHWAISAKLPDEEKIYFHRCDWHWRASPVRSLSMPIFEFEASKPADMMAKIVELLTRQYLNNRWKARQPEMLMKYPLRSPQWDSEIFGMAFDSVCEEIIDNLPIRMALFDSHSPTDERVAWAISQGVRYSEVDFHYSRLLVDELLDQAELAVFYYLVKAELRLLSAPAKGETSGEFLRRTVDEDVEVLIPTFNSSRQAPIEKGLNSALPYEAFPRISSWYLKVLESSGREGIEDLLGTRKHINGSIRKLLKSGTVQG